MRWQQTILTMAILGAALTAGAQDSMPVRLIREQTSPVVFLRDEVYASPALKVYQRENTWSRLSASFRHSDQELYLQQEGSGRQTFNVHSETYLKPGPKATVWGQAYYSNEELYKVKFNETADYQLVYPYVMADSVGGDLKSETYAFAGGLAKAVGAYQLGFQAGFKGLQTYRDRDPRPENISSVISLGLSASRKVTERYTLALDLSGLKYGQNNKLDFVSELGYPLVYHEAGLGAYNEFLAGARTKASFQGLGYGVALNFVPVQYKGWFARAGYNHLNIGKRLTDIIDDISVIHENTLNGAVGYMFDADRRHFIAELRAATVKREGIEARFINTGGANGVQKIAEDVRYVHDVATFRFRTVYGRSGGAIDWFAGLEAGYEDNAQQYVMPNRELSYSQMLIGADITARKQLGGIMLSLNAKAQRQENLESTGRWNDVSPQRAIFTMLNSNFAYLTASGMNYGGGLRADFRLTGKVSCFISADAAYHSGIERKDLRVTTAFQF
ncbi:DUF6850 family outer membrane beta-barrel protein [Chitinophaga alhagiae]|uniref:DUF6850 family outer membrane beta-barrel protein n=1 Tax=Chitinophaga alhagiae TaxID=2203219 RepID=UPI001300B33D|nr:DUF6850 family outer membrane beta-barrel protein [Chitinophaga alhagiae]